MRPKYIKNGLNEGDNVKGNLTNNSYKISNVSVFIFILLFK